MASRRWIDLAMLTPGTSQDNIRGQFYRGNVNVGAGSREYSNGFVVDGVNNTWAEMGEPRQNFAMDAIQEFKVSTSTYKAEYGLATGGLRRRRHQVRHQPAARLRPAVLPRRVDHREGVLPDDEAGLPPVSVRRHDRRADRARTRRISSSPTRGRKENQFFTVNAARPVAAVRGHVPERRRTRWTYNVKLDHQLSQATEPVLPLRRRGRVPADHHGRRPTAVEQQLRLRGAAQVGGASGTPG